MEKSKRIISVLLSVLMLLSTVAGLNLTAYAGESKPIENGGVYYIGDTITNNTGGAIYIYNTQYNMSLQNGTSYYFEVSSVNYANNRYVFISNPNNYIIYTDIGTATSDKIPAGLTVTGTGTSSDPFRYAAFFAPEKEDPEYTAPIGLALNYDNASHTLITPGSTSDGTMYYKALTDTSTPSVSDSGWSTTAPSASDVGTYYIWYYVKGDDTHNDTEPQSVTSTITEPVIEKYPVWVGGTQFTENLLTVNGSSGTATYNPSTNTVTLNNYQYSGYGCIDEVTAWTSYNSAVIYTNASDELKIVLEGESTIENTADYDSSPSYHYYAVCSRLGNVVFEGDGTLNVNGTASSAQGITAAGNISFNAGTINANVSGSGTSAIVSTGGNVTFNGSTVNAYGPFSAVQIPYDKTMSITANSAELTFTSTSIAMTSGTYSTAIDGSSWSDIEGTGDPGYIPAGTSISGGLSGKKVIFPAVRCHVTTAPVGQSQVYNGKAKALVTEGACDHGVMKYSTDGVNFSTSIPTATEIGTYTVYYKAEEMQGLYTLHYPASEVQSVTATIIPTPTKYPLWVNGIQYADNVLTVNGDTGTAVFDPSTYTLTLTDFTCATAVGHYEYIQYNTSGQYGFARAIIFYKGTEDLNIVINGENALLQQATSNAFAFCIFNAESAADLIFSGDGSLDMNYSDVEYAAGYTMVNSVGGDIIVNDATIKCINQKSNGDYNGFGFICSTFTQNSGDVEIATWSKAIDADLFTINGGHFLAYTENNYYVQGNIRFMPDIVNAIPGARWTDTEGTQNKTMIPISSTARALDEDYYRMEFPAQADLTPATVTFAPMGLTLPYNGKGQYIAMGGAASGGTLVFSLDGENYSEDYPQKTNVGTYPIYYKVIGDEGHTDTEPAVIYGRITPIAPTVTPPVGLDLPYTGSLQTIDTAGSAIGGTMYYKSTTNENETPSVNDSGWTTELPQYTPVGTYYTWYYVEGDANHTDTTPARVTSTIYNEPHNGYNLTLDEGIKINFLIDTPYYEAENGFFVCNYITDIEIESANREDLIVSVSELETYTSGDIYNGDRKLTLKAAPAQIGENFIVKLYAEGANPGVDAPLETFTVSIEDYCNTVLANSDKYEEKYVTLAQKILNYGQLANEYFSYAAKHAAVNPTDDPYVVTTVGEYQADLTEAELNDLRSKASASIVNQGSVAIRGVTYITQMDPEFRFYLGTDVTEAQAAAMTLTVSEGLQARMINTKWGICVSVTGLKSNEFGRVFTLTIGDTSINYNGYAYLASVFKDGTNNSSQLLKNLAKGIYRYSVACNEAFA